MISFASLAVHLTMKAGRRGWRRVRRMMFDLRDGAAACNR